MIEHVFFELVGVLVDPARLREHSPAHLGAVMAERYGYTPERWMDAYQQVRKDWDSYWSDLDLTDDEPVAALWEGLFRTTRALFRLAQTPEPDKESLIAFSRLLPDLVCARFDALYGDVPELLVHLREAGIHLHVATYWMESPTRALLAGGAVLDYFSEPMLTLDVTDSFEKDYALLPLKAGVSPQRCLVVDTHPRALERARAAGLQTALINEENNLRQLLAGIHERHLA